MITLLTGGSACGKSYYAEASAVSAAKRLKVPLYYVATMLPYGEEGEKRIRRHREQRKSKGFLTVEHYRDIGDAEFDRPGVVLLECVGNLAANEMFEYGFDGKDVVSHTVNGIAALSKKCRELIIVTNEVGSDIQEYSGSTVDYILCLGEINRALSELSDNVLELVCGIPLVLKGKKPLEEE